MCVLPTISGLALSCILRCVLHINAHLLIVYIKSVWIFGPLLTVLYEFVTAVFLPISVNGNTTYSSSNQMLWEWEFSLFFLLFLSANLKDLWIEGYLLSNRSLLPQFVCNSNPSHRYITPGMWQRHLDFPASRHHDSGSSFSLWSNWRGPYK